MISTSRQGQLRNRWWCALEIDEIPGIVEEFRMGAVRAKAGGFEPDSAKQIGENGDADMVVFGRHFAANPGLPSRIQQGFPLDLYDQDTFWGGDNRGYTDYPFYSDFLSEQEVLN